MPYASRAVALLLVVFYFIDVLISFHYFIRLIHIIRLQRLF